MQNIILDSRRDLVVEKLQRLFAGGSDVVLCIAVRGFCADQIGFDEIMYDLLYGKIVGIFLFQKEIGNLCVT